MFYGHFLTFPCGRVLHPLPLRCPEGSDRDQANGYTNVRKRFYSRTNIRRGECKAPNPSSGVTLVIMPGLSIR